MAFLESSLEDQSLDALNTMLSRRPSPIRVPKLSNKEPNKLSASSLVGGAPGEAAAESNTIRNRLVAEQSGDLARSIRPLLGTINKACWCVSGRDSMFLVPSNFAKLQTDSQNHDTDIATACSHCQ